MTAPPVYIVGIAQRSGTHFLYDLLVRHPECRPALRATSWEGSWEDHLLEYAQHLVAYADGVTASNRMNDSSTRALLLRSLGSGLDTFVRELDREPGDTRRPVTKTPMSANVERAFELWPDAILLLLVRDPLAVVASAVHTFGGPAEMWIREWRRGARRFIAVLQAHPGHAVLIRYEDLFVRTEATLREIFAALQLDGDYDFTVLGHLPVRGSAQLSGPRQRKQWLPTARTDDFDPVHRGAWLSTAEVEQVRCLALPEMRTLGYAHDGEAPPRGYRALRCRAATVVYAVNRAALRVERAMPRIGTRLTRRR